MVAIVLGILKIIGILLLIILGLILFMLFSVLLVPVRYRAEGSVYEHLKGSASASWFLRLISIKVSYDGEAQMDFRILWFHPGREKHEKEAEGPELKENLVKENISDLENGKQLEQELAERVETTEIKPGAQIAELPKSAEQPKTAEQVKTAEQPKRADENQQHQARRFGLSVLKERFGRFVTGLKEKFCRIRGSGKTLVKKIRNGKAQWETFHAFIQNEENKAAFCLAKRQIFALIRHVLPQKLEGKIHFGFGDPYTTGQVLTWISPFYGLYGRHVQVCPDFMEPCLDGELKMKGRIRLGTLIFLVFRMFQNKQIRLWVKKWRES